MIDRDFVFTEGMVARMNGKGFLNNPHPTDTDSGRVWIDGYVQAMKDERKEPLPTAYGNCTCHCHRIPNVYHCMPCCYPEAQSDLTDPLAELMKRYTGMT